MKHKAFIAYVQGFCGPTELKEVGVFKTNPPASFKWGEEAIFRKYQARVKGKIISIGIWEEVSMANENGETITLVDRAGVVYNMKVGEITKYVQVPYYSKNKLLLKRFKLIDRKQKIYREAAE